MGSLLIGGAGYNIRMYDIRRIAPDKKGIRCIDVCMGNMSYYPKPQDAIPHLEYVVIYIRKGYELGQITQANTAELHAEAVMLESALLDFATAAVAAPTTDTTALHPFPPPPATATATTIISTTATAAPAAPAVYKRSHHPYIYRAMDNFFSKAFENRSAL